MIGCCPVGSACAGSVNVAAITTITVQVQQQTQVVYVNPQPTVVYNAPVGFCATLTMHGDGLPTTTQGDCGTILIVSEAPILKILGYGVAAVAISAHLVLGYMLVWVWD